MLVTTDLAARGIDILALKWWSTTTCPLGHALRAPHRPHGRARERGLAVSFVSAGTEAHWRLIESRQHLSLPREQVPGFEPVEAAPPALPSPGTGASRASAAKIARSAAATATRSAGTATERERPQLSEVDKASVVR